MEKKTNVMRILDKEKIKYKSYDYSKTNVISGIDVVKVLNQKPEQVFKTLVTVGHSKNFYAFVVPVNKELNLKKAALAVDEKNIEMLKQKDLFSTTGYIHGGCSPIGMKKQFPTVFDISALDFDSIIFSAGKIGYQVEVSPCSIQNLINAKFFNITN